MKRYRFVLLLLLLTGCTPKATPQNSGVEIQTLIGPICPVVQQGAECPDQPYQATLSIFNSHGKKMYEFETDKDGKYRITLEAGSYTLHPETRNGMTPPFAADQTFVVEPDKFTRVTVRFDSGIR